MKINQKKSTDLLKRYLRGNLTDNEEATLFDWINKSDKNYKEFKNFISANQFSQEYSNETIFAWEKLKSEIDKTKQITQQKNVFVPNWIKVAAMLVFAALSGFFVNQFYQDNQLSNNTMNEVIVPNGERVQLILSDGTKVHLNSGSVLKYPSGFAKNTRNVSLNGEAIFEVFKNVSKPFLIETSGFDVRVTGTSFNLKSYNTDRERSLTLYKGGVLISTDGAEYKVTPGEKYIYDQLSHKSKILSTDIDKSGLWQQGIVNVEGMQLSEIAKILERKFGVKITIMRKEYANIQYTGQFKQQQTLEEILEIIKATSPLKFNYEFNNERNKVIIK